MTKATSMYLCSECGWRGAKWYGRCPTCGQWGTVQEYHAPRGTVRSMSVGKRSTGNGGIGAVGLGTVSVSDAVVQPITDLGGEADEGNKRLATGFSEFDRVLGGGIVSGSVVLVVGEPGIGKSTLLLETAANIARAGRTVLYVSGEESAAQIRLRGRRVEAMNERLLLASTTDLGAALDLMASYRPDLAIVDSVQTITSGDNDGISGGSAQVREVAHGVIGVAKSFNIPTLLVGHVTKDGSVAGPRTLEHLVDVVCQFEGDSRTALRTLRAIKNRFGPTDEVGCFDMDDTGINEVTDPSGLFVSSFDAPSEGTCITFTLEGRRSIPIEIQALVTSSTLPAPRRVVNGVDYNRVAMLVAVMHKHARVQLLNKDLYLSTIAGGSAKEPSCDLAACVALASAVTGKPVPRTTAAFGEVSLTGEVRPVPRLEQRLLEAQRLGFCTVLVPARQRLRKEERIASLRIVRVSTIQEALTAPGVVSATRP
ncbi:MAG: DNA repair protein RadA [Bifidobacteriaceae bacterium]|nr:DNA repair protein RadA [Bifidobacteriaceae bacterium]